MKKPICLCAWSFAFLYAGFQLIGCAAVMPTPVLQPVWETSESDPNPVIVLHFDRPLNIRVPEKDPETVEEWIRYALFYFENQRYSEAAEAFGKAALHIDEHDSPIYRTCLKAKSVSALLTGDRKSFVRTIKMLKNAYSKYELIVIDTQDQYTAFLFRLYDLFVTVGNI